MTLEELAVLSNYKVLASLDAEGRIQLVCDERNTEIRVKKTVKCDSPSIYRRLQEAHLPGLPEIYLVIEDDDEVIIIEDYIHGVTAEKHFGEMSATDLNDKSIAKFGIAICDILSRIHSMNPPIICRDIKPSNIMCANGDYYLTDFNIARSYQSGLNEDTHLLGTAPYAAPEQYGFGQTDERSDIYSLGITMNVLRTGCLPKDKVADGRLGAIIEKATSMDPSARYANVAQLRHALLNVCSLEDSLKSLIDAGLTRLKKRNTIIAIIAYISILIFLFYPGSSDKQMGYRDYVYLTMFFELAFLPYLYNANYFGILDKTIGKYRKNKALFWILRIGITILLTFILTIATGLIFL